MDSFLTKMMYWNNIPDDEKLRLWKKLRDDVKQLSAVEVMREIAKFCAGIPFGYRTLDYYSSEEWPTPWEIIYNGTYCTSSISLLIYYTLVMLDSNIDAELILVDDTENVYLLPIIDNQYILNYENGQVNKYSEIKDNLSILQRYTKDMIKSVR